MLENQLDLISYLRWLLALCLCLSGCAAAQRTTVEKNGVGGRIETDYDAAGKTIEMRTIGPDSKLQQKVDYQYLPGYYGAQQTDTTYWPNGKTRKIVEHTYDASTNFTGEFIETFDDSGKQTGGHKLTHDPWTGIYRCSEWDSAVQKYRSVVCPAGEEEGGGGEKETPHAFTYEEVIRNLELARTAASRQVQPKPSTAAGGESTLMKQQEVGLVLPSDLHPGEQISGVIVMDPTEFEEMPEVTVTRIALPLAISRLASGLSGWQLEIEGEKSQPADGPLTFAVPSHSPELNIVFRQVGNPDYVISKTVSLRLSSGNEPANQSFRVSPLCLKGQLCVVKGRFSGNSDETFASFDDRPATILAEDSDALYLRIPDRTAPGPRTIFLQEGSKVAALPVVVGEFVIEGNGRQLKAGETLIAPATLSGPSDLPETAWEGDDFPAASLAMARHFIAAFQLSEHGGGHSESDENDKRSESEEEQHGEILVVIKNEAPQATSVRASSNDLLIFHLGEHAFEHGDFKYNALIQAQNAGKVNLRGYVIPFLSRVSGQEFDKK